MVSRGRNRHGSDYLLRQRERASRTIQTIKGPRRVAYWTKWETVGRFSLYAEADRALALRRKARGSLEQLEIFYRGSKAFPCCGEYGAGSGIHDGCAEVPNG
jgi:hypothetical protein